MPAKDAGFAVDRARITPDLYRSRQIFKNPSSQGWYFYFDFLECAVASAVPDPATTTTAVGVATDFDTDNTYKLLPQRLVWNIQKLGLLGER